jgi:hypothetical protein
MSFMVSAIAVSAATGIYGAYQTNEAGKTAYEAAKNQAKGIEAQAKADLDQANLQMQLDSQAEGRLASAERKENRRLRAMQEAAYATSGVLMEGSAADVLVKQREVQEANVQNIHLAGGNQRAQDRYKASEDFKSSMYLAQSKKYAGKVAKRAATQKATMQLVQTAASAGMSWAKLPTSAATPTTSTFGASSMGSLPSSSIGRVTSANSFNFGQSASNTSSFLKPLI